MGIENEMFVSPVEDEFLCPICSLVLDNPVQISSCEHVFCRKCIEEWVEQNATCPVDEHPFEADLIAPDVKVVKRLNRLKMKCEFESMGCKRESILKGWKYHLENCEFNPKNKKPCVGCGLMLMKQEEGGHKCLEKLEMEIDKLKQENDEQKKLVSEYKNREESYKLEIRKLKRNVEQLNDFIKTLINQILKYNVEKMNDYVKLLAEQNKEGNRETFEGLENQIQLLQDKNQVFSGCVKKISTFMSEKNQIQNQVNVSLNEQPESGTSSEAISNNDLPLEEETSIRDVLLDQPEQSTSSKSDSTKLLPNETDVFLDCAKKLLTVTSESAESRIQEPEPSTSSKVDPSTELPLAEKTSKSVVLLDQPKPSTSSDADETDSTLEEKITTTSIDKWILLSQLPSELKNRVRLAFVLNTDFVHEVVFITDDDEAYWIKSDDTLKLINNDEVLKIDGLSGIKVKQLTFAGRFDKHTCVFAVSEDGQLLALSLEGHRLLKRKDWGKVPKLVPDLAGKTVIEVACGHKDAAILTEDGEVWAEVYDQPKRKLIKFAPIKFDENEMGSRRAVAVACSCAASFALMDNGDVYSWGSKHGALGRDTETVVQEISPAKVELLAGVKIRRLAAGGVGHVLAVADDGSMYAWGLNDHGQLGTGDKENRSKSIKVGPEDVRFIEVASCHSCHCFSAALSDDGRCWVWGACRSGDGNDAEDVLFPRPVKSLSIHDAIAEYAPWQMSWKTMIIRHKNKPSASFKANSSVELTFEEKISTTSVDKWSLLKQLPLELKNKIQLAFVFRSGYDYEAVFTTENDEMFWLEADPETLKLPNDYKPYKIEGLSSGFKFKQLTISGRFRKKGTCVLAVTEDGRVFVWSLKGHELLKEEYWGEIPKLVSSFNGKTVVGVACGDRHALVLTDDGEVWSWGANNLRQLGRESTDKYVPMKVTAEIDSLRAVAVACFDCSSFAVMDNGDVYAWGCNKYKELGLDAEVEVQKTPTKVEAFAGAKIRRLACGFDHILAVSDDGSMFSWGNNSYGELGTGDKEDRSKPVKVGPDGVKFVEVVSSPFTSTALSDDGRCWVWGACQTASGIESVLLPKNIDSATIYDALADYSPMQMSWKPMLIRHH